MVGLPGEQGQKGGEGGVEKVTDRPTSKAGDAMGENSVVMLKMPSNLRSGKGAATEQEMRVATLNPPFSQLDS